MLIAQLKDELVDVRRQMREQASQSQAALDSSKKEIAALKQSIAAADAKKPNDEELAKTDALLKADAEFQRNLNDVRRRTFILSP